MGVSSVFAQTPQPSTGQADSIIRLNKREVVVDVVVRDKRGRLVNDLNAGEITVVEDGVQQKVTSFRNVQGREQLQAERSAAHAEQVSPNGAHPLNTLRDLNFVSIVVAPMSRDDLALARDTVHQFLKSDVLPNTYITVFKLDAALHLVQPYTQDRAILLAAVDRVTKGVFLTNSGNQTAGNLLPLTGNTSGVTPTSGPTGPPSVQSTLTPRSLTQLDATQAPGAALDAEIELQNRLRFIDSNVTGMTMLDQIRELVHSQARLPGRKVVLYMADGLSLPADEPEVFNALVSDANRAGVTFYTVDTRGLSGPYGPHDNPLNASVAQLNRTVQNSQAAGALMKGNSGGAEGISSVFDSAHAGDDVQLLAVSNTQLALQELATRTGGFAVANTNELAKPMERVMEDIRTHYELAYTPSSDVYDGHFRKIEVKVDRPKVTVQSRSGYFALPDLNGQPLQPFEMAALKAINTRPLPNNVAYDTALLQFRPNGTTVQCAVAFDVPIAGLKVKSDPKTSKAQVQASVVALIQDADRQVVGKVSRQLVRIVPTADITAIQKESIEYAEPVELAPGHYTISTAVIDGGSNAISVKRIATYVKPSEQIGLSSLELVKRVSPMQGERNPSDPFELPDGKVILALSNESATDKPVDLYFVVYPKSGPDVAPPKLLVELLKDGKEMARMNPALPAADATGAIPMVAELKPPSGEYDVRVTVTQGTAVAQSNLALTVH